MSPTRLEAKSLHPDDCWIISLSKCFLLLFFESFRERRVCRMVEIQRNKEIPVRRVCYKSSILWHRSQLHFFPIKLWKLSRHLTHWNAAWAVWHFKLFMTVEHNWFSFSIQLDLKWFLSPENLQIPMNLWWVEEWKDGAIKIAKVSSMNQWLCVMEREVHDVWIKKSLFSSL